MKRLYIRSILIIYWIIIGLSSCSEKNYKMVTKINSDTSALREMYAYGDSAFLAGDMAHNPFLFKIGPDWKLEKLRTADKETSSESEKKFNVKISRKLGHLNDIHSNLNFDEVFRSFVVPEESVKKHFRWFYTTYTYTGKYKKLDLKKIPIPIDKYMDKNAQKLWFQGITDGYEGRNGLELKSDLDEMESQFFTWLARNIYEASFITIAHFIGEIPDSPYTTTQLTNIKDSLFQTNSADLENLNFQITDVCKILDQHYKTTYFSTIYEKRKESIDKFYDQNFGWGNDLFTTSIEYKLIIPGEIFNANTKLIKQDTLTWKIDGIRLIADDYQLVAESRVENKWAFILTFIFVLAIIRFIVMINKKNRKLNSSKLIHRSESQRKIKS